MVCEEGVYETYKSIHPYFPAQCPQADIIRNLFACKVHYIISSIFM